MQRNVAKTPTERTSGAWAQRGAIHALFLVSGGCGLAWQALWVRAFTPVFGVGLEAVSAVTAVFLGGLGVGAAVAPRLLRAGDPERQGLRVYATAELLVGAWGAALPWVLLLVAHSGLPLSGTGASSLLRPVLAAVLVGPPAVALGTTLPAVARALGGGQDPRRIGLAYALNALGAAMGAWLAGLWLPWWLGIRHASLAIAAANVLVAFGALLLSRRVERNGGQEAATLEDNVDPAGSGPGPTFLLAFAVLTGLQGMILEVAWSRLGTPLLAARLGGDQEAFAIVLSVVLAGIGLGSLATHRARRHPIVLLAVIQVGLGLAVLATLEPVRDLILGDRHFEILEGTVFLLPALLVGGSFPVLSNALIRSPRTVLRVGPLSAANTVGSVLGSLSAGFLLVPWLGAQRVALLLGAVALLAGAAGIFAMGRRALALLPTFIALGALAVVPRVAPVAGERLVEHTDRILASLEGREASTLVVERSEGSRSLLTGGLFIQQAPAFGVDDHALRAIGPSLLHPNAHNVLSIGLGTGATAAAFLKLPMLEHIVVVELDENQRDLLDWFGNAGILSDPRLELVTGDGRGYLRSHRETWDVIAVDAFGPRTTSAAFYTSDFYAEARARLAPGGLVFTKINTRTFGSDDVLESYLCTLFASFPVAALVVFEQGFQGLVGLESPSDTVKALAWTRSPPGLGQCKGARLVSDDHPVRVAPEGPSRLALERYRTK
jgi:spermidine synthase